MASKSNITIVIMAVIDPTRQSVNSMKPESVIINRPSFRNKNVIFPYLLQYPITSFGLAFASEVIHNVRAKKLIQNSTFHLVVYATGPWSCRLNLMRSVKSHNPRNRCVIKTICQLEGLAHFNYFVEGGGGGG